MMVAHYGVCSFKQRRIFLHKFPFSKEIVFFHDWAQIRFAQFFIFVAESLALLAIVVHSSRQSFFRIGGECYVVIVVMRRYGKSIKRLLLVISLHLPKCLASPCEDRFFQRVKVKI